jgi:hypothetical protein
MDLRGILDELNWFQMPELMQSEYFGFLRCRTFPCHLKNCQVPKETGQRKPHPMKFIK